MNCGMDPERERLAMLPGNQEERPSRKPPKHKGISRDCLPLALRAAMAAKRTEQYNYRRTADRVTRAELVDLRERLDRLEGLVTQLIRYLPAEMEYAKCSSR